MDVRLKNFCVLGIYSSNRDKELVHYFQIVNSLSSRSIDQRSALCIARFPRSRRRRPSAVYFLRVHRPITCFFYFILFYFTFVCTGGNAYETRSCGTTNNVAQRGTRVCFPRDGVALRLPDDFSVRRRIARERYRPSCRRYLNRNKRER